MLKLVFNILDLLVDGVFFYVFHHVFIELLGVAHVSKAAVFSPMLCYCMGVIKIDIIFVEADWLMLCRVLN